MAKRLANFGISSKKLTGEFPYDSETPLLGMYPRELRTEAQTKTFRAALCITAKKKKKKKTNSTGK